MKNLILILSTLITLTLISSSSGQVDVVAPASSTTYNISGVTSSSLFATDTTDLKGKSAVDGKTCFLRGLTASSDVGAGWFVYGDSAYPEGGIAFDAPETGKQWVRQEYINKKIINVKWFGAVGDGITDDTQAIQNALDLYQYAKKVFFPKGHYITSSTLRIYPGQIIYGVGANTIIERTSYNIGDLKPILLPYESITDSLWDYTIEIKNLMLKGGSSYDNFDYTTSNNSAYGLTAIDIEGGAQNNPIQRVVLNNVIAKNFGGEAIVLRDIDEVYINNLRVQNCNFVAFTATNVRILQLDGFYADSARYGMELYGCTFPQNSDSTDVWQLSNIIITNTENYGINLYGENDFTIDNFYIQRLDTSTSGVPNGNDKGIYLNQSNYYPKDSWCNIQNGYIEGYYNGIYLGYTGTLTNIPSWKINIENTRFKNNYGNAIYIYPDTSTHVELLNINSCKFYENNQYDGFADGALIRLVNINNATITNNVGYNNKTSMSKAIPIYLDNSKNIVIRENNFKNPNGTPSIWVRDNCSNILTYNNLGLNYNNALYWYESTVKNYQTFYVGFDSSYTIGAGLIGFKYKVLNNDSLCVIKYDNTGSPIDTTKIR